RRGLVPRRGVDPEDVTAKGAIGRLVGRQRLLAEQYRLAAVEAVREDRHGALRRAGRLAPPPDAKDRTGRTTGAAPQTRITARRSRSSAAGTVSPRRLRRTCSPPGPPAAGPRPA